MLSPSFIAARERQCSVHGVLYDIASAVGALYAAIPTGARSVAPSHRQFIGQGALNIEHQLLQKAPAHRN